MLRGRQPEGFRRFIPDGDTVERFAIGIGLCVLLVMLIGGLSSSIAARRDRFSLTLPTDHGDIAVEARDVRWGRGSIASYVLVVVPPPRSMVREARVTQVSGSVVLTFTETLGGSTPTRYFVPTSLVHEGLQKLRPTAVSAASPAFAPGAGRATKTGSEVP